MIHQDLKTAEQVSDVFDLAVPRHQSKRAMLPFWIGVYSNMPLQLLLAYTLRLLRSRVHCTFNVALEHSQHIEVVGPNLAGLISAAADGQITAVDGDNLRNPAMMRIKSLTLQAHNAPMRAQANFRRMQPRYMKCISPANNTCSSEPRDASLARVTHFDRARHVCNKSASSGKLTGDDVLVAPSPLLSSISFSSPTLYDIKNSIRTSEDAARVPNWAVYGNIRRPRNACAALHGVKSRSYDDPLVLVPAMYVPPGGVAMRKAHRK